MKIDREAAEQDGSFGRKIRQLKPDAVIDLICFTPGYLEFLQTPIDNLSRYPALIGRRYTRCKIKAP